MMDTNSENKDSTSCCHLDNCKRDEGKEVYHYIHAVYVSCVVKGSRAKKAKNAYCHTCKKRPCRIRVCMSCPFFGCVDGGHMKEHAREKKHFISVDLMFGKVYCNECEDYMYDEELENISKNCKIMSAKKLGLPYKQPWHPTKAEVEKISENFNFVKLDDRSLIGIKGVQNLGHTCYISTILQALAHTPILKNHYLSENHKCSTVSNGKVKNKNRKKFEKDTISSEVTNSDEETKEGGGDKNGDTECNEDKDYTDSNEDKDDAESNEDEDAAASNEDKDDADSNEDKDDADSNDNDSNEDEDDTDSNEDEDDTDSNEVDTKSNKDEDTNSNEDGTDSREFHDDGVNNSSGDISIKDIHVNVDLNSSENQSNMEYQNFSEFPNPKKTTNPSEDPISNRDPTPNRDPNIREGSIQDANLGESGINLDNSDANMNPDLLESVKSSADVDLDESDANRNSDSWESVTSSDESDANSNESDTNSVESDTNSDKLDPSEESESFKNTSNKYCMGCELSKVYEEFYRGNPSPATFHSFEFKFIKQNPESFMFNSSGDAFEVFALLIPKLHEGDCNSRKCTCIIGKVFDNVQRKDTVIVSSICNATNKRGEILSSHFIMVPYPNEMETSAAKNAHNFSSTEIADHSTDGKPVNQIPQFNLLDLIERNLNISPIVKECPNCKNKDCKETTYQRGYFLKLPVIFCFHLPDLKKEGRVAFPEHLDMRKLIPSEVKSKDPSGLCDFGYTLYAVVEFRDKDHRAKKPRSKVDDTDGGHYVAYIRQHLDRWFFINDEDVEPITFEKVAQVTTPTVLFYYKNVVDHAGTTWMSKVKIPTQKQLDKQFQRI